MEDNHFSISLSVSISVNLYIRNIYYSNFHSCLRYGIILWGGDSGSNKIFKLQKKALRIIGGVSCHMLCRQIFKDYNITQSSLYILEVIHFIKKYKNSMVKIWISIIIICKKIHLHVQHCNSLL
jgi:hypothetical protein